MLDINTPITVQCRTAAGGLIQIPVRWPTDEEWAERARGQKWITIRKGRGQSQTDLFPGESDLRLFEKIRQSDNGTAPPVLSPGEATTVISALATCTTTDFDLSGNDVKLTLETIHGEVQQSLRLPTADEVLNLKKAHVSRELPFNKVELVLNHNAMVKLWDTCGGQGIGYAGGVVPAIHKEAVISELLQFLAREVSARTDEKDF
jgi:hypothetical protein